MSVFGREIIKVQNEDDTFCVNYVLKDIFLPLDYTLCHSFGREIFEMTTKIFPMRRAGGTLMHRAACWSTQSAYEIDISSMICRHFENFPTKTMA